MYVAYFKLRDDADKKRELARQTGVKQKQSKILINLEYNANPAALSSADFADATISTAWIFSCKQIRNYTRTLSKLGTSIIMFFSLISCILALFRKVPFGPVPENTSCDFYVGIMCRSVNSSNSGILDIWLNGYVN